MAGLALADIFNHARIAYEQSEALFAKEGSEKERNFAQQRMHWSRITSGLGAASGVALAVAAYVQKRNDLIVLGAVLAFSNGVGFYYLKELDYLAPLNDYVIALEKNIADLRSVLKRAMGTVEQIGEVDARLSDRGEEFRAILDKGKETVSHRIQELSDTVNKLKAAKQELKEMQEKCSSFREEAKKLIATEGQLSRTQSQFQETTGQLNQDLQTFKNQEKIRQESVKKLQEHVEQLDSVQERIDKTLEQMRQRAKAFNREYRLLSRTIERAEFQKMHETKVEWKKNNEHLQQILPNAQSTVDGMNAVAQRLDDTLLRLTPLAIALQNKDIRAAITWFIQNKDSPEAKILMEQLGNSKMKKFGKNKRTKIRE